jgi:O-antigen ligase
MNHVTTESAPPRATMNGAASGVAAVWLERLIVGCLFAFAFSVPHSIAAAQGVWVLGMLAWVARFAFRPRPTLRRTPVDYALLGFFVLTFITSFFSYEPDESLGKLRAASLFTIVYLTAENIPSRRVLRALVLTLVASCMLNVAYTFVVRVRGHGVKVNSLSAESPLRAVGVETNDTLLEVDRAPLKSPADIENGLRAARTVREATVRWPDGKAACVADEHLACMKGVRAEVPLAINIERGKFLEGATPEARLGIVNWSRGRDERATGFYGQYTTYAEVLQLTGSLALGLLVALVAARRHARHEDDEARRSEESARRSDTDARQGDDARLRSDRWSSNSRRPVVLLALACVGISGALLLTVTRASWVAFIVSILLMVTVGVASRRTLVVVALAVAVVAPLGLYVLRQKRGVGLIDQRDLSTTWRETVWREGFQMLISKPRHLLVGVGMDSLKRRWREWGMFDHGRLPWGHLHSTPLQIAFERGLPTLAAWLALLFLYWRLLWRLARRGAQAAWVERGLALGALGGAVGFFTSGLVHYNLGDSEVAMVFYFIMGLALALEQLMTRAPSKEIAT